MRLLTSIVIDPGGDAYQAPAHVDGEKVLIRRSDAVRSGLEPGDVITTSTRDLRVTNVHPMKGACRLTTESIDIDQQDDTD